MLHYVTVRYTAMNQQHMAIESALAELLEGLRYHRIELDQDQSIIIRIEDDEVTAEVAEK